MGIITVIEGQEINLLPEQMPCIIRTLEINPLDGHSYVLKKQEWAGDRNAAITISHQDYHFIQGDDLPWQLELLSENWLFSESTYIRLDNYWYPVNRFNDSFNEMVDFVQKQIGWRLLWTCQVWGLAWIPQGEVPSWRHHFGRKRK